MQVLATYRFTVDKYHRFGTAGILGEDDRVELLNGDLITMAPIGGEHRTLVDTLNLLFARLTENDRFRIGIQNPVSLVHRKPDRGGYQTKLEARSGEAVNVEALPGVTLQVGSFLASN